MTPKEEVIEFVSELQKMKGCDELPSKIIGMLFIEDKEISMEQLAERTGYSLSAVSTTMKILIKSPAIKKLRKPGSKKLYFYMEKNIGKIIIETLENTTEKVMKSAIHKMPKLIENYKKEKPENYKKDVIVLEKYYRQLTVIEKETKKFKENLKRNLADVK